ncbi:uncharacterized protein FOMMEDRAFT_152137 [Fomitiporia mediterranea MF3/22]|uniref:uncharacterized protein n=1 Tax=Fomitiporia mediterranea (strain MF3/22) TaxID=694068 RepID=UPI0004407BCD|nr:uncharacterized protein FOMMEDRAFT_152137 [Fomitiporia mediterranea MF3/22]EJD06822.1 hypothetical protein FOMMEDRAFT_152137 [Fomitiporia mediterranea MF3/22]
MSFLFKYPYFEYTFALSCSFKSASLRAHYASPSPTRLFELEHSALCLRSVSLLMEKWPLYITLVGVLRCVFAFARVLKYRIGAMVPRSYGDHSSSLKHPHRPMTIAPKPSTIPPISKKRRAPNAFILFRSHFIATGQVPSGMVHQNDVSRYVAEVWKSKLTPSDRAIFFKKAQEEKARFDIEGPREPAKKRRRSKKAHHSSSPNSTAHPDLLPSPTSSSDDTFEAPSTSSSIPSAMQLSPQNYSSPNVHPSPTVGDAPLAFSAPQPMHTIPPILFDWYSLVDNHTPSMENQDSPTNSNMMPLPESSASSYIIDCSMPLMDPGFNALQLDFNFQPADLDMSFFEPVAPEFLLPLPFATPF